MKDMKLNKCFNFFQAALVAVHTLQEGKKSGRSNAVHQRRHRYESAFVFLSMAQG
jgi:hypothetical protein